MGINISKAGKAARISVNKNIKHENRSYMYRALAGYPWRVEAVMMDWRSSDEFIKAVEMVKK